MVEEKIQKIRRDSDSYYLQLPSMGSVEDKLRAKLLREPTHEEIPVGLAVVARFEDTDWQVRKEALKTLGKLEPAALAQHAEALVGRLEDSDERVRARALDLLRGLPRYVSEHRVDIFDSRPVRSRLLGRLGWYRYRLRMRVRRLALYWYALPYRPSGPGHARDVEAWEQMNTEA